MKDWVLGVFTEGFAFIRRYSQVQLALVLVVVVPLLFLYSGNLFLDAGKVNQDKLQRDRVEVLHQSLAAMVRSTEVNTNVLQAEVDAIAESMEGLTKLRVVLEVDDELLPVVALDKSIVGVPQTDADLYYNAAVRDRASVIFPFRVDGERIWQSVYVDTLQNGQTFYVLTEISFAQIDQYFARNADRAYAALFVLYILLIFIAYWHARMVNYRTKYQEATEALEQQQLFTNMVAHELRAPLTAIRGYTSLMQERNQLSEPEQTHVQRVRTSTERLLSLVNDLLDVARIQSGKLEMNPKTTELGNVVEDVITELQVSAKEKEITLQQSGLLEGARAHVDPKRIHQALVNLVSNAIKYTKSGTIELEISQKRKAYEIRVKDTGMGMTAEDQRNLFAPFFRIQQEGEQAESGSGLGMWITRQFIELMEGDIAVESIKGVGTHVVITVPRAE